MTKSKNELVVNSNGQLVTNSLLVAEKFKKRHSDVIRSIESLISADAKVRSLFVSTTYEDEQSKLRIMYVMSRDGFTLLAMGFNGKKALSFKLDFIEAFNLMENKLKEIAKPLSTLDLLELTLKGMRENQQELAEVKQDVLELKAKTQTRPDYFTIVGYGTLNGISVSMRMAQSAGKRASSICKNRGIETDEIPDPRFGKVKMYPKTVLEEVFNQPL